MSFWRLSPEASAEAGQWSTDRVEYQRGIMDAISDDKIENIVVMSCAQIGKTEMLLNLIGYHIDQEPAPMLVVQPTPDMAATFSRDRLSPMLRDTKCLSSKVKDPRSRDSGNTLYTKQFDGGHITLVGSNSASGLASRPIRLVLFDEVDRYQVTTEGDAIDLAKKRAATFGTASSLWSARRQIAGQVASKRRLKIQTNANIMCRVQTVVSIRSCGGRMYIGKRTSQRQPFIIVNTVARCGMTRTLSCHQTG